MKKILSSLALAAIIAGTASAQAPSKFNYQGIARNGSGTPLASQPIGMRLSILDGSAAGTPVYVETQTATTNAYGLYNVQIGGGTAVTGTPGGIAWYSGGSKYLKVEMDPAGGTAYTTVGTSQLLSVPYAANANSVQATSSGGAGLQGGSGMYWGIYEGGIYRGYLGSYSGKTEDVDFGTGGGNTLGSLNLTIQGNPKMTIDSIGRVGIGTRFPQTDLTINSGTNIIHMGNQNGYAAIGIAYNQQTSYYATTNGGSYLSFMYYATPTTALTNSNTKMLLDGAGNAFRPATDNVMSLGAGGLRWTAVYAANGTIQTSDERFKTNIQPLNSGLNAVMQLQPISYNWKNESLRLGTGVNYGFSAQELSKTLPDLVIHTATTIDKETGKPTSEYADAYGVKYAEMTPVLVKAIQEQQAIIQQQQALLEKMQQRLEALEAKK